MYRRPIEMLHIPIQGGMGMYHPHYADQVVSYDPLFHGGVDVYRSNLMLNSEAPVSINCPPIPRRHSHESDFNAELFHLNNLSKVSGKLQRKSNGSMSKEFAKQTKSLGWKNESFRKDDFGRGRSILRRSTWYRRKPSHKNPSMLHRHSFPVQRNRQNSINIRSSVNDLTNSPERSKVKRSFTSVADRYKNVRKSAKDVNDNTMYSFASNDNRNSFDASILNNDSSESGDRTWAKKLARYRAKKSAQSPGGKKVLVSAKSSPDIMRDTFIHRGEYQSKEYSSISSSSSNGLSSRQSSLQSKARIRLRGLQR